MRQSINRRQTCPITRRESEQLLDFFLSIPTSPKEAEKPIVKHNHLDNDAVNNNIKKPENDSCCEHDRPEFKRSDSYRKATQKFTFGDVVDMTMTFKKEDYNRQKYLSLPLDIKTRVKNDKKTSTETTAKKNKLNRQISGTVPSSDSDAPTNQPENRQKKSIFKRTKERFIFKFWKDKAHNDYKRKNKISSQETSPKRTTNFGNSEDALGIHSKMVQPITTSNDAEATEPKTGCYKPGRIDKDNNTGRLQSPTSIMAPNSKSPARARHFRTQVSREEITNMFEKILSSAEVNDEPFKFPSSPQSRGLRRKDFSPNKNLSFADGIKDRKARLHLDIVPCSPAIKIEDQLTVTTETTRTSAGGQERVTTKTTLERTVSLEIDGDEVDGLHGTSVDVEPDNIPEEEDEDQEKMIEEIARRLNRIADDYVQRMGDGESHVHVQGGAVAEPLLSPRSRSKKLANDLITELRKEGDRLSRELDLPENLLPIVMAMVKQVTYDHFKELVEKALCETIGWDQVAMYFYVSRAAILMAGVGGTIAKKLKNMVVKYFYEEISPWIHDKGGLETMLEETDSEVD